jgi:hypothetical protein
MKNISVMMLTALIVVLVSSLFATSSAQKQESNLASDIFNNKTLTVPSNVKNFVILIPNEAHESPALPKDQRLINQPYIPQNLVVGPDTKVIWFVGDVGHTRRVNLTDTNSKEIYNALLHFNSASKPLSLNQTGKFTYSEFNANKEDPNFVMKGSITVLGNNNGSNMGEKNSNGNFGNMAILMVPTRDINKHSNTLLKNNMNILSEYSFKDLRQTGGGGANQTLLVLGSNDRINMITSVLKKITSSLPYS